MSSSKHITQQEFDGFSKAVMGLITVNSTVQGALIRALRDLGIDWDSHLTDDEAEVIRKATLDTLEGIAESLRF